MSISNPQSASKGNRSVAESVKAHHTASKNSTDWISSRAKPMRVPQPGASANSLKAPRRSHSKPSGLMD